MSYYISNGIDKYITYDIRGKKYVVTKDQNKRYIWDSEPKAVAILKNNLTKDIQSSFFISSEEDAKHSTLVEDMPYIEDLDKLISQISEDKQNLLESLSEVDKEICDIQHYIEFNNLNAYEGWTVYDMLKTRLQTRRKIKNKLAIVDLLKNTISREFVSDLKKNMEDLGEMLDKRKYKPRVLNELFN